MTKQDQLKQNKKPRKKKCKVCASYFEPERPMQTVCSFECSIKHSKKDDVQKKAINKAKRESRANDKSLLRDLAQKTFNTFIRLRDKDLPCISCGHIEGRQFHAGHFQPAGANPQLRFNELNVHKQCSICNNYKSGNLAEYRKNLILKIGLDEVEKLESDHSVKKYSVEDYKDIIKTYKEKIKQFS